jgi:hypothetical protein
MDREQKISSSGWTMLLGSVYLLSPFPVGWAISSIYGGIFNASEGAIDFLMIFYYPIIVASSIWHPIGEFYSWGFRLLGVP